MSLTVTTPNIYNDLRRPVRFRVATDRLSNESYTIDTIAGDTNFCNMTILKSTYPTITLVANDVVLGSNFTGAGSVYNTRFNILSVDSSSSSLYHLLHCEVLLTGGFSATSGYNAVVTRNNTDLRLKIDLTVSNVLLTTFYMSYSGVSYVDVYVQRYLQDLIAIGTIPSLSSFGSVSDNENLLKTFSVLFTEQNIDDGIVYDGDTYNSANFYGIDAIRPIENSNINDHIIVAGYTHSFLTDRNYIRIRSGDVYHLSFITSETTVRIKTYEGGTIIDSRDVTSTNGYITYSFLAGSSNRAVAIYTTADVLISEVIYFVVENNCRGDRVYYRNRWGGYDMDYVNVEIFVESQKEMINTSLPYSYNYQTDRKLRQINKSFNDTGIITTPMMSDLHAWQLIDSNDVYLILDGKLYPIIITTNSAPKKLNKLSNFKLNFKFSNNGNAYT